MKTIKVIVALLCFGVHTVNAVWYNPFTWFSSSEESDDMMHEENSSHHCRRCK